MTHLILKIAAADPSRSLLSVWGSSLLCRVLSTHSGETIEMRAVKLTLIRGKPSTSVRESSWAAQMTLRVDAVTAQAQRNSMRLDVGNPAGNAVAVCLVLHSELSTQCRLFIENNKGKKRQPNNKSIFQNDNVAEDQALTQDQR